MSHRALVVASTLQAEMPEFLFSTGSFDAAGAHCPDAPIVVVADNSVRGMSITVYGADCDDIDAIAREADRAIRRKNSFHLYNGQLSLTFTRAEPVFDEADYRIGERLFYKPVESADCLV